MSQDQTLHHTLAREQIKPKKVLEEIEVSKEQSIQNHSGIGKPPNSEYSNRSGQNCISSIFINIQSYLMLRTSLFLCIINKNQYLINNYSIYKCLRRSFFVFSHLSVFFNLLFYDVFRFFQTYSSILYCHFVLYYSLNNNRFFSFCLLTRPRSLIFSISARSACCGQQIIRPFILIKLIEHLFNECFHPCFTLLQLLHYPCLSLFEFFVQLLRFLLEF